MAAEAKRKGKRGRRVKGTDLWPLCSRGKEKRKKKKGKRCPASSSLFPLISVQEGEDARGIITGPQPQSSSPLLSASTWTDRGKEER